MDPAHLLQLLGVQRSLTLGAVTPISRCAVARSFLPCVSTSSLPPQRYQSLGLGSIPQYGLTFYDSITLTGSV